MCTNRIETTQVNAIAVQEALNLEYLLHRIGLRADGTQALIRTHPRDVITQHMTFLGQNRPIFLNEANAEICALENFENNSLDQILQDIFLRDSLENIEYQLEWIATYVEEHTYED